MNAPFMSIRVAPFLLGLALVPVLTFAQSEDMRVVPRSVDRTLPDDSALENDSRNQEKLRKIQQELDESRAAFSAGQPPATQIGVPSATTAMPGQSVDGATGPVIATPEGAGQGADDTYPPKAATSALQGKQRTRAQGTTGSRTAWQGSQGGVRDALRGSPVQVFGISARLPSGVPEGMSVLPVGSHVKARIVSGVEANAREPYPVLLQLDYAFTGPNKSRIDLSNCFMVAKAKANLSTERVMMETDSLSCVKEDGEHFKREAKGFVAGEDNTFGATGTYISKQGQVLLAAVLASIAKNAGQAIADAQKSTSIVGADKAATATNITGNKAAYIGGAAMVDGASMVAQWYLEQAKDLIPSIGVGSGQDVFVIMLDTISVPSLQGEE